MSSSTGSPGATTITSGGGSPTCSPSRMRACRAYSPPSSRRTYGQTLEGAGLQPYLNLVMGTAATAKGITLNTNVAPLADTSAARQNVADARSQADMIAQLQGAVGSGQLTFKDGQVTRPDGSVVPWGSLVSGLGQKKGDPWGDGSG